MSKVLAAAVASVVLVVSMAGCASQQQVAATVNGQDIYENDVTSYINYIRAQYGLTDADMWQQYLSSMGMTAQDIRAQVINMEATNVVVAQDAERNGITVDDSIIDQTIQSMKSSYSSDEEWNKALESMGIDEAFLRHQYQSSYLQQAVEQQLLAAVPTDEQVQQAINSGIASYGTAKRSSHILFSADDQATAQTVLQQLKDGADFAAMAQQYSQDTGSAARGGDVGWDSQSTFVTEYQTALDGLSKGQMTQELVQSQFGYHIILCTDEFAYDPSVTYTKDNLPDSIYQALYDKAVSSVQDAAYYEYSQTLMSQADLKINDMPEGLPYDTAAASADGASTAAGASDASTATQAQ